MPRGVNGTSIALSTYCVSAQSSTQMGAQTPLPPRSTLPSGRRGAGLALSFASSPGLLREASGPKTSWAESNGNKTDAISARRIEKRLTERLLRLPEHRRVDRHIDFHIVQLVGVPAVQPGEGIAERELDSTHVAIIIVIDLRRNASDGG